MRCATCRRIGVAFDATADPGRAEVKALVVVRDAVDAKARLQRLMLAVKTVHVRCAVLNRAPKKISDVRME
jgi:hypothetical protein